MNIFPKFSIENIETSAHIFFRPMIDIVFGSLIWKLISTLNIGATLLYSIEWQRNIQFSGSPIEEIWNLPNIYRASTVVWARAWGRPHTHAHTHIIWTSSDSFTKIIDDVMNSTLYMSISISFSCGNAGQTRRAYSSNSDMYYTI